MYTLKMLYKNIFAVFSSFEFLRYVAYQEYSQAPLCSHSDPHLLNMTWIAAKTTSGEGKGKVNGNCTNCQGSDSKKFIFCKIASFTFWMDSIKDRLKIFKRERLILETFLSCLKTTHTNKNNAAKI